MPRSKYQQNAYITDFLNLASKWNMQSVVQ